MEQEIAVIRDDFTLAITDTETGEIVSIEDAPEQNTEISQIVNWVGNRRAGANAKLQGLQAEKAEWIDKVNRQYDARIKHLERFVQYLDTNYTSMLRDYAKTALEGKNTKTLKIAFLELSFGTTRARVDIIDNDKAVEFCERRRLLEAIKVVKSVLKSAIPDEIKLKLTADTQEETGIVYYPGGEETFTIR